jgi:hypothetical protein
MGLDGLKPQEAPSESLSNHSFHYRVPLIGNVKKKHEPFSRPVIKHHRGEKLKADFCGNGRKNLLEFL